MGGISLAKATCLEEGLQYDRRMMLADSEGKFLTQREIPHMALIGARLVENGFEFYRKNNLNESPIFLPHDTELFEEKDVQVWKHTFKAKSVLREYSEWFSDVLNFDCTLYKMDRSSERYKSLIKAPTKTLLSMADGYPYLFISEASLSDLNRRLIVPVPMNRFRPNIVIEDCQAYNEEGIDKFTINGLKFRMIKACVRCTMITIDQKTGKKLVEPLKTLSTYKKQGNNVYFGMNAVNLERGSINVGDEIIV